jgi:hypothetical protein
MSTLGFNWVRAARTRAPSATNYDVYASRRKILQSPGPKCNGAGSSRPSTFWIMDSPRPGKCVHCCSEGFCTSDLPVVSPSLWVSKAELRKVRNWIQILRFALLSPICTILRGHYPSPLASCLTIVVVESTVLHCTFQRCFEER